MTALWTPSGRSSFDMGLGSGSGRNLATVMRTQGPFQGVDLSRDPRELGPMYAQVAHNVHCAHGAIERRPGISLVANGELPAEPEVIYHHSSATGDVATEWYAAAVYNLQAPPDTKPHWQIYTLRANDTVWLLRYTQTVDMTTQRDLRPNFYRISKEYVLVTMPGEQCFGLGETGSIFPLGTSVDAEIDDLVALEAVSQTAPTSDVLSRWAIPPDFTDDVWAYYWVSFLSWHPPGFPHPAHPVFGSESNAIGPFKVNIGTLITSFPLTWVGLDLAGVVPYAPYGTTHIRLFRNMYVPTNDGTGDGIIEGYGTTAKQVLVKTLASGEFPWQGDPYEEAYAGVYYDIPLGYLSAGLSFVWDGSSQEDMIPERVPPTRNARPPRGVMLTALHQSKMFYARVPEISSVSDTSRKGEDVLWYSAELEYWHVAELNAIKVGEDGRPITGLMTYFGNLLIFKEDEVWMLRGSLDVATNVTDAHGDPDPWGTHELSLAARGVGCIAVKGGPAVLEAGNLLYFVGQGGLYVYNGQVIAEVSQAIAPALRGLSVDVMAGSQLAHDPINKLIYWYIGAMGTPDPGQGPVPLLLQVADWEPQVWVYHYADATDQGGGRWTHWGGFGSDITCIASRQTSVLAQPPGPQLVLGLASKRVAQTSAGHIDAYDPINWKGVDWLWHGADLHLGAPERATHWHYLTTQFERQSQDAAKVSAYLDADLEQQRTLTFDLDSPGGRVKWRLGLRANTLAPRFSGLSEQAPVRITGFQIDALPIGSR